VNCYIEELPFPTLFPDDKAGISGGFTVDHDLGRTDSSSFGDVPEADGHAYDWPGKVHQS
jgi:hypothetical protein